MPFSCISVKADRIRAISSSSEGIRWLSRVMVSTVSTIWAVSSGKLHWMLPSRTPWRMMSARMGFSLVMIMRENFWCMKALSCCSLKVRISSRRLNYMEESRQAWYMISSFLKASRWEDAAGSLPSSRTRE